MIYIIELDRPIGNPAKRHGTAKYYIGYCDDGRLLDRLNQHNAGQGAKMLAAAKRQGIGFGVVATFPGDRTEERRLKNQKNTPRIVRQYRERALGCLF